MTDRDKPHTALHRRLSHRTLQGLLCLLLIPVALALVYFLWPRPVDEIYGPITDEPHPPVKRQPVDRLYEIIVPSRRGKWTGAVAEAMAAEGEHFDRVMHLSYQPGDSGLAGWDLVHQRGVDGRTFVVGGPRSLVSAAKGNASGLERDDIAVVYQVSDYHHVMAAKPGSSIDSWRALLEHSQRDPSAITIAGNRIALYSAEYVLKQAGINAQYRKMSRKKSVAALVNGEVDLVVGHAIRLFLNNRAQIQPILALGSGELSEVENRYANTPVLTADQVGLRGLSTPVWVGMHPQTPLEQQLKLATVLDGLFSISRFKETLQRKGHLGRRLNTLAAKTQIDHYVATVQNSDLVFDD